MATPSSEDAVSGTPLPPRAPARGNGAPSAAEPPPSSAAAAPERPEARPPSAANEADETPEYRSLALAVDAGRVSFHQVATAWFNWHFGGERCDECQGRGQIVRQPDSSATCPACTLDCSRCRGKGTIPNEDVKKAYEQIFPELLGVFGEQRGGVITSYFCENIRVGAALTDIPFAARADGRVLSTHELEEEKRRREREEEEEKDLGWVTRARRSFRRVLRFRETFREEAANTAIHLEPTFGDPDSPRAKHMLFRCLKVHYQALEYLKPKPRKICMRMTFNVITTLLGTLDNRIGRGEPAASFDASHEDIRTLEEELASTEAYYRSSAQRTARLEYFGGMIPGLLLAALIALLISGFDWAPADMAIAFIAGSIGALVSVMERLTGGKLNLNHEAGKATLRILGAIRPFIGALFGLALFVFISGDFLVSIDGPADPTARSYFFAAVAFLAGFSERWAQDMIDPSRAGATDRSSSAPARLPAR